MFQKIHNDVLSSQRLNELHKSSTISYKLARDGELMMTYRHSTGLERTKSLSEKVIGKGRGARDLRV